MNKYYIMYFFDCGKNFGGAVNVLMQQAILMKKAGHKISIAISAQDCEIEQGYQEIFEVNGIEHISLNYSISSNTENIDIISVISGYDDVKKKIEELRPDILHSVQINPIAELVSRELHIPHIMNIYQLIPDFFSIPYTDIFPHYHICDSEYFAERWHKYLGTDSVCIRTVVNYSNNDTEKEVIDRECVYFMCVGVVCRRKNQLNVIKAFHLALQRGVEGMLNIYGYDASEYGSQCKDYVKKYGLEERIIFKGFCADMNIEYEKGDVLICGSTMESYPNVISEALAKKLIVISTPVAGVPEVIKDGYNGYLCADYTEEAICDKIEQFIYDRKQGRAKQIAANAYHTYKKYHSPGVVIKELLLYYKHAIEDARGFSEIGVDEIKQKFSNIIKLYNERYGSFTKPQSVRLKLWYIYHIKNIIDKLVSGNGKKFYIWGTGKYAIAAKETLEVFFPDLKLDGFIDTYKTGEFCRMKIYQPDSILDNGKNIVFVGMANGQEEVLSVLKQHCREYNKNYFILAPRRW